MNPGLQASPQQHAATTTVHFNRPGDERCLVSSQPKAWHPHQSFLSLSHHTRELRVLQAGCHVTETTVLTRTFKSSRNIHVPFPRFVPESCLGGLQTTPLASLLVCALLSFMSNQVNLPQVDDSEAEETSQG